MITAPPALTPKPDHVPDACVVDFDYINPAGIEEVGYYAAVKRLHDGPDIQWSPRYGGHWILTRAEDIKIAQEKFAVFSHEEIIIPRAFFPMKMLPLSVDPPHHARYRAILNPYFTPPKMIALREKARELTGELIEQIKPQGRCEFVNDFARVMPVNMFLSMVDLPHDRREEFVKWGAASLSGTAEQRQTALARIAEFLKQVMDERAGSTSDDIFTSISNWRYNPRFEDYEELMAMAIQLFLAGLDTVASSLSFIALYLAERPALRKQLRESPDIIPRASEEFFRRFGLSSTGRLIKEDITLKGVTIRKGDMVMVSIPLSGIDDRAYANPMEVDFNRVAPHNTFGNGPHKCVGAPLARAEIQIFLQEFLNRIPDFRLDPNDPPVQRGGSVAGMNRLPLLWD